MTRKEIIDFLKARGVEFNPTLNLSGLEELYLKQPGVSAGVGTLENVETLNKVEVTEPESDSSKLLKMMSNVVDKLDTLEIRLSKVEGPNGSEFKNDVQSKDVEIASKKKENIDSRITKIVEETLGIDFGIDLDTFPDKPGFLFTVIVPPRLSDMSISTRPIIDSVTGKYKVQEDGKTPVLEDYVPEDRRSRSIGSSQSYDAIRDHCNKVRSYLVSYYVKLSKPLPEFKLKV